MPVSLRLSVRKWVLCSRDSSTAVEPALLDQVTVDNNFLQCHRIARYYWWLRTSESHAVKSAVPLIAAPGVSTQL